MGRSEKDALKKMMAFNRQFMETNQAPELKEITEFMLTLPGQSMPSSTFLTKADSMLLQKPLQVPRTPDENYKNPWI